MTCPDAWWHPCAPCKDERHDDCTGYCPSICCALDTSEKAFRKLWLGYLLLLGVIAAIGAGWIVDALT